MFNGAESTHIDTDIRMKMNGVELLLLLLLLLRMLVVKLLLLL